MELKSSLDLKISDLQKAIDSTRNSRDNDTKSSAGDKHETSRAMAQIELDKLELQLNKTVQTRTDLNKLNSSRVYDFIEFGSLVETDSGYYYISIGHGKIRINEEIYYAISIASPIGNILKGKQKGDLVGFNQKEIEILGVY